MSLHSQFNVRNAGITVGRAGTARVKLDFDTEATSSFFSFLEKQCDETALQGILGVFRAQEGDDGKVLLIISNTAPTETTAAAWITAVNAKIQELSAEELECYTEHCDLKTAMAVSADSSSGVSINTRGLSSDA